MKKSQFNIILNNIIMENQQYSGWRKPSLSELKQEYDWEYINQFEKHNIKYFNDFEDFVEAVENGKILPVTEDMWYNIENSSHLDSIEELENMVSSYKFPRDVQRIVNGFLDNDSIPVPIIVNNQYGEQIILGGNTRMNAAFILGVPVKALFIDVVEK